MTVRMGYDFAKTGVPKKFMPFWGEEEQRNERAFRACTETSDMKFVTTRAKQRRGETLGQERHSGKTAKSKVRQSANFTLWQKRKKRKGWVA